MRSGLGSIYGFDETVRLLAGQPTDNDSTLDFPYAKEVNVVLLLSWILWPTDTMRFRSAARLIGGIIALHRVDAKKKFIPGLIEDLRSLQARLRERWFRDFHEHFYAEQGGLSSLLRTYHPSTMDRYIERRKDELRIPLDMLEYLFKATHEDSCLATRQMATKFIAQNGFDRSDVYGIARGTKKQTKPFSVSPNTISPKWDDAPSTLGLAYLVERKFPRLNCLRMAEERFLEDLMDVANDTSYFYQFFAQYHWLVDFFRQRAPRIEKFKDFEFVDEFVGREEVKIDRLTEQQLLIANKLRKKTESD
jgi:hypothetical protein